LKSVGAKDAASAAIAVLYAVIASAKLTALYPPIAKTLYISVKFIANVSSIYESSKKTGGIIAPRKLIYLFNDWLSHKRKNT
jgi:hypothetical protein